MVTYRIVFDCKLRKPGCVLLQVAMGGDVPPRMFNDLFPAETWLVAPTPDMRVYCTTESELRAIASVPRRGYDPL